MKRKPEVQCFLISESTIVGIYLFQGERFLYVNPAFARIFGYDPKEIMSHLGPLDLTHPDDRELVSSRIQACLQGEIEHMHHSFRGLRKDGETIFCEVYGKRTLYDGAPAIAGTIIDISERAKAEERLFWELAVSKSLSELSRALAKPGIPSNTLYKDILQRAASLTKSPCGILCLIDPATGKEIRRYLWEEDACGLSNKQRFTITLGEDGTYSGLLGHTLNTRQGFFTNTPSALEFLEGQPDLASIKCFLAVPAILGNQVMGEIALANAPDGYSDRDLEAVRRLAEIQALVAKREQEERALTESEQKYKALTESSLTGIFILQRGKYVFVNNRFAKMHGYKPQELLGKHHLLLVHPQDKSKCKAILSRQAKGKRSPGEYEIRRLTKDKRTLWCKVMAARIRYQGRPAVMGNVIDITPLKEMEMELRESLKRWQKTVEETVHAFGTAVEQRDPYTAGHQKRVAELAMAIAEEMGLSEEERTGVYMAGLVHDIGKISVPAEILSKPGKLTEAEYAMLKAHPKAGYNILKCIEFPWPIADLVLQHHERLDGSGYPHGLSDGDILLGARILAVADVVEAMASHRPYRPALGLKAALEEIKTNSGTLYDPQVVAACIRLFRKGKFAFDNQKG